MNSKTPITVEDIDTLLGYSSYIFFSFNDTSTPETYTLSLHDALPISAGIRGLAVEARDGVGIMHHRRIHHLDRAAPPHLDVLGEIDLTHAAFAQLLHDVVAIGNDLADQVARGRRRPQRLPVVGTELHVVGIFGGADRTDLHAGMGAAAGSSTRRSLSPTMMRDPCCSGMAPRAAIATPLRL